MSFHPLKTPPREVLLSLLGNRPRLGKGRSALYCPVGLNANLISLHES